VFFSSQKDAAAAGQYVVFKEVRRGGRRAPGAEPRRSAGAVVVLRL